MQLNRRIFSLCTSTSAAAPSNGNISMQQPVGTGANFHAATAHVLNVSKYLANGIGASPRSGANNFARQESGNVLTNLS